MALLGDSGIVLGGLLLGLSFYLGSLEYFVTGLDKLMAFECGFIAFKDSRSKFNISYYLLGILFLIFDLEIAYLLPWVIITNQNPIAIYIWIYFFLVFLTVGFIYEWVSGALSLAFIGR